MTKNWGYHSHLYWLWWNGDSPIAGIRGFHTPVPNMSFESFLMKWGFTTLLPAASGIPYSSLEYCIYQNRILHRLCIIGSVKRSGYFDRSFAGNSSVHRLIQRADWSFRFVMLQPVKVSANLKPLVEVLKCPVIVSALLVRNTVVEVQPVYGRVK